MRRSRYDMHKAIDADYYGFRDEDDGVLLKAEAAAERAIKKQARFWVLIVAWSYYHEKSSVKMCLRQPGSAPALFITCLAAASHMTDGLSDCAVPDGVPASSSHPRLCVAATGRVAAGTR